MLSYSEIPLENWAVGKSSSVVYSSAFPQCDLRQVKFNFINLRCGSLFLKLQIRCPWQLSCKLSPQSTFLQIVVLNNFFANCTFGYFCPQILQISFLDIFLKFDMAVHFSNFWKLVSWTIFLQIVVLDSYFANFHYGQFFKCCTLSLWAILFCKLLHQKTFVPHQFCKILVKFISANIIVSVVQHKFIFANAPPPP